MPYDGDKLVVLPIVIVMAICDVYIEHWNNLSVRTALYARWPILHLLGLTRVLFPIPITRSPVPYRV